MKGHGTTLSLSDMAGTPAFTAIAAVTNIKPPSTIRGTVDNSDHDTTNAKAFLSEALYEMGDVTMTLKFDPSDGTHDEATGLLEAARDGDVRDWKVTFTDATVWDFSGFLTSFDPQDIEQNAPIVFADITIKPTGAMTIA